MVPVLVAGPAVTAGGAGRVGHYAVQWASQAGATVIATASNDDDKAVCKAAGAAHVVNHRSDNVVGAIMEATGGELVDRIVDVEFGANLATSIEVLRIDDDLQVMSQSISNERSGYWTLRRQLRLKCVAWDGDFTFSTSAVKFSMCMSPAVRSSEKDFPAPRWSQ